MFKNIHVVINPASGSNEPILNVLNAVFQGSGIEWGVSITKKANDAKRAAQEAASNGCDLVVAYGGDGTVMEVAGGLMDSGVPMAVLPGGTANVLSVELGIPSSLMKAAQLITAENPTVRDVDMGLLNDERLFILRFATGFEAQMDILADRKMKDRFGKFSYSLAGIMALKNPLHAEYTFTLDGRKVACEGVSCMVANTSNLGVPGLNMSRGTSVSDGLLDVVVFKKADRDSLLSILTFSISQSIQDVSEQLASLKFSHRWQAKEIIVEAAPVQDAVIDGETAGETPCHIKTIPSAVGILVP
jgi:YegS/Rv2252/BmrU family lipid kinase